MTPSHSQLQALLIFHFLLRPPIDKYGTLQFDSFDEIREVGYYHGQTYFAGLRKAGQLWFLQQVQNRRRSLENLDMSYERSSSSVGTSYARFTDLAEMVCRVRQVTPVRSDLPGLIGPGPWKLAGPLLILQPAGS